DDGARRGAVPPRRHRPPPRGEEDPDAHALRREPGAAAGDDRPRRGPSPARRPGALPRGGAAGTHRPGDEPGVLDRRLPRPHRGAARLRRPGSARGGLLMQTVLLAGGTGYLGSKMVEALLGAGHRVIVLKRPASSLDRISRFLGQAPLELRDVDAG